MKGLLPTALAVVSDPSGSRSVELRQISSTDIDSLQFLDARKATLRFGSGHVHGAILVKTRS